MGVGHWFASLAATEVGVDGAALDGAGADEGDFNDDVVEAGGFESGQGGDLGAGFDLEYTDSVGCLEEFVYAGIFWGQGV